MYKRIENILVDLSKALVFTTTFGSGNFGEIKMQIANVHYYYSWFKLRLDYVKGSIVVINGDTLSPSESGFAPVLMNDCTLKETPCSHQTIRGSRIYNPMVSSLKLLQKVPDFSKTKLVTLNHHRANPVSLDERLYAQWGSLPIWTQAHARQQVEFVYTIQ